MFVSMVRIRHMGVGMPRRIMAMQVAVGADGHCVMWVVVMTVFVLMRVFMRQGLMLMFMVMRLSQVDNDTEQHQQAQQARRQPPPTTVGAQSLTSPSLRAS